MSRVSLYPPVSTRCTGCPLIIAVVSTGSRVTPGWSFTIAIRRFKNLLKSVDFSSFLEEAGADADIGDLSQFLNGLGIDGSNLDLSELLNQITSGNISDLISGSDGSNGSKISRGAVDFNEVYSETGLPGPDGIAKASGMYESDGLTSVEVSGMSYDQFVSYCYKLEGLDGWQKISGSAGLPDSAPETGKTVLIGSYGSYSEIRVTFNSAALCQSTGCAGVVIELFD